MMSYYENTSNDLDRTTIVAIARDNMTKSAFIFNSSAGLREPSNEYKYLLEFFEITLRDINGLVTLKGEYDFGGFSYKIYEELPYANHYNRDQKTINVVKKRYIDKYNDNDIYPLYNQTLNDKAKAELSEKHNGNIIKLYNELHYKKLKEYYDDLETLIEYDFVNGYLKCEDRGVDPDIATIEVSRMYLAGDKDAGIELLLRKKSDYVLSKLSRSRHITELKENFELLLNAYKLVRGLANGSSYNFDTNLLARHLYEEYYYGLDGILTKLVELSKEKLNLYFDNKDNSEQVNALNGDYKWLRKFSKERLFYEYIEIIKDKKEKKIYLYALYDKQNN